MVLSIYKRLESFRDLEQGWYGYDDSPPISLEAINEAKAVLDYIYKNKIDTLLTSIFVAPENWGGVGFEIENEWEGGKRGLMFDCPLAIREGGSDFYIYEEQPPLEGERNGKDCSDWEGNWGFQWMTDEESESADGVTYKTMLEWVCKKEHQCSN